MSTPNATDSLANDLPPYDPQRIVDAPFPERLRLACTQWANSSPNRPEVMALYWGKYFFVLIGVPGPSGAASTPATRASSRSATGPSRTRPSRRRWSGRCAWELFGFGCGWGPMNARFDKWFGGYRHFARVGTIKLPLFRGVPR